MSRLSELKVAGTGQTRFSNSPITKAQGGQLAGAHRGQMA